MGLDPISAVAGLLSEGIKRFIPDKTAQAKANAELAQMVAGGELQTMANRFNVIIAEAQSDSWLTRSWRPITMLTFVSLIVAHWMGWSQPNLSEAQLLSLFDLVKIGLGGYVIGRSAEVFAKNWKPNGR